MRYPTVRAFVCQWIAVVAVTVFTVMLCAFLFVPASLGFHPGDAVAAQGRHMT